MRSNAVLNANLIQNRLKIYKRYGANVALFYYLWHKFTKNLQTIHCVKSVKH